GDDLDVHALRDGIVETGRSGAAAGIELARAERRDHLRRRIEADEFDLDAGFLEVAFLVGDEEGRVARCADDADIEGLAQRGGGQAERQGGKGEQVAYGRHDSLPKTF